jgi:hypothetical protein
MAAPAGRQPASATGRARRGNVTVSATATGDAGGRNDYYGGGGYASATTKALSRGAAAALSSANAIAGEGGFGVPLLGLGDVDASSEAETATGALAQAQSSAFGFYGSAPSSAKTSFDGVSVQSTAAASFNWGKRDVRDCCGGRLGADLRHPG